MSAAVPGRRPLDARDVVIALLLIVACAGVFGQVRGHDFVRYDDPFYVTENPHVLAGLEVEGVIWAFTHFHFGLWIPLTSLSHMLDVELFGLDAGAHHVVNLLLHATNAVLLFLAFRLMTSNSWRSGLVAILFAIHPLHVESVAWISTRKDVLSGFFMMLTLLAYAAYAKRPGLLRYLGVFVSYALGLMAKPTLVALPLLLLLLDYWPLSRLSLSGAAWGEEWWTQIREKLPLFALSAVSALLTLLATGASGGLVSVEKVSLSGWALNIVMAYAIYVTRTLWPVGLSFHYPRPVVLPTASLLGALLLLVGVSAFAFRLRRRRPYLVVGWLWFLVTLLPVGGFVAVFDHQTADRYMYVPLIGLSIMLAWGLPEAWRRRRGSRAAIAGAVAVGIAALSVAAWRQASYWRDGETLFRRGLVATPGNPYVHSNFGMELALQGRLDEAIGHYEEAIRLRPGNSKVHSNLGLAFAQQGRLAEAIEQYYESVSLAPRNARARFNLGIALQELGRTGEAVDQLAEAHRLDPTLVEERNRVERMRREAGRAP